MSSAVKRLWPALSAALLLIGAAADGGGFDPPTDVTFRYTIAETRDYGAGAHRFTTSRLIRFQHTSDEVIAAVTPTSSTGGGPGDLFLAAMSGLNGRTLRFHVAPDGRISSLDDGAAHWQAFLAGVERIGRVKKGNGKTAAPPPATPAQRLAGQLRLAPPSMQEQLLSSLLAPVIGVPLPTGADPAAHPIKVSAKDPEGGGVSLDGAERTTAEAGGIMVVTTSAAGALPATAQRPAARLSITRARRIDTRTGLVLSTSDRRETTIGDGSTARRSIITSAATLAPVS